MRTTSRSMLTVQRGVMSPGARWVSKVQLLRPSPRRARAMSGPVSSRVSMATSRASRGKRRSDARAVSARAMGRGPAALPGRAKPAGSCMTSCAPCSVTPGTQRRQPSSNVCGHCQVAERSPSTATWRPVASLRVWFSQGFARFQSSWVSTMPPITNSPTKPPARPSAKRCPLARRDGVTGFEGADAGTVLVSVWGSVMEKPC